MKLFALSDLHLEFWQPDHLRLLNSVLPSEPVDVLVLGGDILVFSHFTNDEVRDIIELVCSRARHVLFVLGNHEFYGSKVEDILAIVRSDVFKGVTLLDRYEDKIVEIEGRRFIGCTTWFPDGPFNREVERYMNDFKQIRGFKPWVYEEHKASSDFLLKNVRKGDIVITHHLPIARSTPKKYAGHALNCFFVSQMDKVIGDCQPSLWIHGHTHTATDYTAGDTRVLCNPLGYPGEVSHFDSKKIIEI